MNRLKLEALASSILIYLIIIVTIFGVSLYNPEKREYKNFVEKKSEIIEVSLGSPVKRNYKNSNKKSNKNKKKKKVTKKREIVKKIRNIKPKKRPKKSKPKTNKIKKSQHKSKKSNMNASSLFKKLPTSIKDDTPSTPVSGKSGKSLKKSNKGKGIVNRYFAKVQSTLKGWPAQSNFAGEKVSVELIIYSSGLFDYKILSRSLNPEFNRSLKAYLDQLRRVGFGPHSNPKPYKIVVEFIAKD